MEGRLELEAETVAPPPPPLHLLEYGLVSLRTSFWFRSALSINSIPASPQQVLEENVQNESLPPAENLKPQTQIPNPRPLAPNSEPRTLDPELQTLNPKP